MTVYISSVFLEVVLQ